MSDDPKEINTLAQLSILFEALEDDVVLQRERMALTDQLVVSLMHQYGPIMDDKRYYFERRAQRIQRLIRTPLVLP